MAKKKYKVILIKNPNEPEEVTASFIEDMGTHIMGTLDVEPKQDFGYHKGEVIGFFPFTDDRGTTIFICDMNPSAVITAEDLEDGSMLEETVTRFNENRNNDTFIDLLEILRDSFVWVPCTAVFSDEDQARLEKIIEEAGDNPEALVGLQFQAADQTRLIPDILENGDAYFFPIFSTAEAMGKYGEHFSKIQKHILEVIPLARNNEKEPIGIVLNAFSEPFILDKEIWDIVENMKSRLQ